MKALSQSTNQNCFPAQFYCTCLPLNSDKFQFDYALSLSRLSWKFFESLSDFILWISKFWNSDCKGFHWNKLGTETNVRVILGAVDFWILPFRFGFAQNHTLPESHLSTSVFLQRCCFGWEFQPICYEKQSQILFWNSGKLYKCRCFFLVPQSHYLKFSEAGAVLIFRFRNRITQLACYQFSSFRPFKVAD